MRRASNANPAGTDHHKRTPLKRLSVFIQCPVDLFNFGLQGSAWQLKEDDASMGKTLLKDEFAEIAVGNE